MAKSLSLQSGATLVELMVAISIIVFLASLSVVILREAQIKTRDTIRANDLQAISQALNVYHQDTGHYPSTAGQWWGSCAQDACHADWGLATSDWIPDLAPKYISYLPLDPLADSCLGRCYLYRSDGQDYKVLAQFVESPIRENYLSLIDPYRDGTFEEPQENCLQNVVNTAFAWSVYSPGAKCW